MPLKPLRRSAGRITSGVMNSRMTIDGATFSQLIVLTLGLLRRFFLNIASPVLDVVVRVDLWTF